MRTVTALPHPIREDPQVWIPLPDGTKLSARLWVPLDAGSSPVPAILEAIPYRHRDITAWRDSIHHPYIAGHGYACLRVDLRGSGSSDGVLTDEYLEQELCDLENVLAWLAAQPWCTGTTGMMGKSWGGFNALQVAARRPPSLGAIIACSSSDDRYADDVHYMGGCLLSDNLSWASTMFAFNSCPPDPAVVGERWREMWHERLARSGLWLETWLKHQRRDEYWRRGSISEDYGAVQCPVFAVSGWADGYSNPVFRLLEHLTVPRKGLIGPWAHKYPHLGEPGPAVGFLQEVVRWWDHWLKGAQNGIMDEPMLRVFMQDAVPPRTAYHERPGRWVGESSWPSPEVRVEHHPLGRCRITTAAGDPDGDALTIQSPLSVGQYGGKWCSYNAPPDLPYDQREEDGGSLVFDTGEFTEALEILGTPVVSLEFSSSQPVAMVAVRLSDIAPDDTATRISYGLLNLTHRGGHDSPEALTPGQRYEVQVNLNAAAQHIPAGHRLRVAISTSYWPLAWPPPAPVRLTIWPGSSALSLPVRAPGPDGEVPLPPFGEPEGAEPIPVTSIEPVRGRWRVSRDLVHYASESEVLNDKGVLRLEEIGVEVTRRAHERYSWVGNDMLSARGEIRITMGFRSPGWHAWTSTRTVLTSTETHFHIRAELDAYEGEQRVASYNWDRAVPRDHV